MLIPQLTHPLLTSSIYTNSTPLIFSLSNTNNRIFKVLSDFCCSTLHLPNLNFLYRLNWLFAFYSLKLIPHKKVWSFVNSLESKYRNNYVLNFRHSGQDFSVALKHALIWSCYAHYPYPLSFILHKVDWVLKSHQITEIFIRTEVKLRNCKPWNLSCP